MNRYLYWLGTDRRQPTPIIIRIGLLPADGTFSNIGLKNSATRKQNPQITVLNPVLAPALMEAEDSGDTRMGAELRNPLIIVIKPHSKKIQRPFK